MLNPELADKILKLASGRKYEDSIAIARELGEGHEKIISQISLIRGQFPYWFMNAPGYGDGYSAAIRSDHVDNVKSFLSAGGFTGLAKQAEEDWQEEQERRNIEIDGIKAAIKQVEIAERSAKDSKRWAAVSGIGTLISAVAAVITIIFGNMSSNNTNNPQSVPQVLEQPVGRPDTTPPRKTKLKGTATSKTSAHNPNTDTAK